jgi:hypothetical protein
MLEQVGDRGLWVISQPCARYICDFLIRKLKSHLKAHVTDGAFVADTLARRSLFECIC